MTICCPCGEENLRETPWKPLAVCPRLNKHKTELGTFSPSTIFIRHITSKVLQTRCGLNDFGRTVSNAHQQLSYNIHIPVPVKHVPVEKVHRVSSVGSVRFF